MADYDFEDARPRKRSYGIQAAERAVLHPLVGDELFRTGDSLAMQAVTREMYRDRLSALRDLNWKPIQSDKYFQYARNCLPFGVTLRYDVRRCGFTRFCPSCYGRMTMHEYMRILNACFQKGKNKPYPGLHLAEFSWELHLPLDDESMPEMMERLRLADREDRTSRRWEVDQTGACGAFVIHQFYSMPTYVVYRRRGVLLTKKRVGPPAEEKGFEFWNRPLETRADIRDVLARVCHYPTRLMTCPPIQLWYYLVCCVDQKFRMCDNYGKFRNSHI